MSCKKESLSWRFECRGFAENMLFRRTLDGVREVGLGRDKIKKTSLGLIHVMGLWRDPPWSIIVLLSCPFLSWGGGR